jgi:hypothetical protein
MAAFAAVCSLSAERRPAGYADSSQCDRLKQGSELVDNVKPGYDATWVAFYRGGRALCAAHCATLFQVTKPKRQAHFNPVRTSVPTNGVGGTTGVVAELQAAAEV